MILQRDPNKRLSPFKLLKHPFITRYKKIIPPLEMDCKQFILGKMITYHTLSSLMRLIRNLIISSGLAKKEESFLNILFDTLDRDRDGRISFEEFKGQLYQVLKALDLNENKIEKIFSKVDIDKDGYLGFTEFRASLLECRIFKDKEICISIFNFIDKNNDGKITKEDIEQLFIHDYGIINSGLKSIFEGFYKIKKNCIEKQAFIQSLQNMSEEKGNNEKNKKINKN